MARHLTRAWERADGFTLLEVLLVTALALSLAGLAVPLTAQVTSESRARAAASYLAGRLRQARLQAVASRAATALAFDPDGSRWHVRQCVDGNGNGVRRADISAARDHCDVVATTLEDRFPGVRLRLAEDIPDVDHATGDATGVRFGRSAMASCTPVGHCTPGTLYVQSDEGPQYAVRVSGITGRTRLLRFDTGARRWTTN